MTIRKWWKLAVALVILLVVLQAGASLLVRTHRVHQYLVAHLERAFGRPVQVRSFDARLLPTLQFDADGVTVGEDPAFGYEYFLRAERLSAGLRWFGVLRGHFDFGTISLAKPSLILVRDAKGRWNLENWLPPARSSGPASTGAAMPPAVATWNRLQKIEFEEGRINFKLAEEKSGFAFINVSGSVDQVAPGRWQLQLEAQPWRSGMALQSAGTVLVQGDLAGTSSRLQPAQLSLHWGNASLADLLRLLRGQDYGIRGTFSLDAKLVSGEATAPKEIVVSPGDWFFSVQSRAMQIHRWDLTERTDNPSLNLNLRGRWNAGSALLAVEQLELEGPRSSLRGSLALTSGNVPSFELRYDSMGLQASDLLAWYRAFHADVAEGIVAEQYFTGVMTWRGWPMKMESAALSSTGGTISVPGIAEPVRVGAFTGGRERGALMIGPVRVALGGEQSELSPSKKRRAGAALENAADLTFAHDLDSSAGTLSIEGNVSRVEDFLKLATSFGLPLNHGWELSGRASAIGKWEATAPFTGIWSGRVSLSQASLAVAGLNEPLVIHEGVLSRGNGKVQAQVTRVDAFGGKWSGSMEEAPANSSAADSNWKYWLSVDKLDAADMDRWVGPRARPGWLQRLLPSLMGGESKSVSASELVRRVNAEGELKISQLTIEKLKFENVSAIASLHELKLEVSTATADWRGGKVHAKLAGNFSRQPAYEISADWTGANLSQIPWLARYPDRVKGAASGKLQAKTEGVGREELLAKLSGAGELSLKNLELRGWDLAESLREGEARAGASRCSSAAGSFQLKNGSFQLDPLRLQTGSDSLLLQGSLTFAGAVQMTASPELPAKKSMSSASQAFAPHQLKIDGLLDNLRFSFAEPGVQVSAP